jgi:hypothetical protein
MPPRGQAESEAGQSPSDGDPQNRCGRGEWCSNAVLVRNDDGDGWHREPVKTWRSFCDGCTDHIAACLADFPRLYVRLALEISQPRQAETLIKVPFGPSLPLSEAIDAHMRLITETLCSWEDRIRDIARLSDIPGPERPQDRGTDLERSLQIIEPRVTVLLSLGPQDMIRFMRPDLAPEDATVLGTHGGVLKVITPLAGMDAGAEIMHMHYLARRLLLETNPPMPLLPDFRCRVCEQKLLRKAPPPWHEDGEWFKSRCDGCGDEMTDDEYKQNALRWIAYERAHLERPVLGLTRVA